MRFTPVEWLLMIGAGCFLLFMLVMGVIGAAMDKQRPHSRQESSYEESAAKRVNSNPRSSESCAWLNELQARDVFTRVEKFGSGTRAYIGGGFRRLPLDLKIAALKTAAECKGEGDSSVIVRDGYSGNSVGMYSDTLGWTGD